MSKCPYSFPARSRAAMTAYLLDRKGYCDGYTAFPFSWNVKAYSVDCESPKGETTNQALDRQWLEYLRDNGDMYSFAQEDAQRIIADGDWTSWPGSDQGDWRFGFYGRSGGHLCLESWRGITAHGRDFDASDFIESLTFKELRAFYRGIVCADHDFTQKAACEEIEYQLAFIRRQWEGEKDDEMTQAARDMETARPDMYAGT